MAGHTNRVFARFIHIGLAVTLAVAALALAPRRALADVVLCDAPGHCVTMGTNNDLG